MAMKRLFRLAAALTGLALLTTCAGAEAWGLSFRDQGQPPIGNASPQTLEQYDAAYLGDTDQQVIYLTFDAGYENGHTAQILATLQG